MSGWNLLFKKELAYLLCFAYTSTLSFCLSTISHTSYQVHPVLVMEISWTFISLNSLRKFTY